MGSAVTTHSPSLLETVARSTPMVALATTTSAPATTAPEVSRTVPVKVAGSCAKRFHERLPDGAKFARVICEPEMLIPEVAGIARRMVGVQRSWQAELGLAGEQLSRQVVMKSVMDPTPNVLLNLLKVIYIRQRGYVKRKTRDDCEGVRGRSRAGGRG